MTTSATECLYFTQLRDLYGAINQVLLVLPRWEDRALAPALRRAFRERRDEMREFGERVEALCRRHGAPPSGIGSRGATGLIDEADEWLDVNEDALAVDLGLVAAARRLEHHEMAILLTACGLSRALGFDADRAELERALGESENEDEELAGIQNDLLGVRLAHA